MSLVNKSLPGYMVWEEVLRFSTLKGVNFSTSNSDLLKPGSVGSHWLKQQNIQFETEVKKKHELKFS